LLNKYFVFCLLVTMGCAECQTQDIPLEEARVWQNVARTYTPLNMKVENFECGVCGWDTEECVEGSGLLTLELYHRRGFRDPRLDLKQIETLISGKCDRPLTLEELESLLRWAYNNGDGPALHRVRYRVSKIDLNE